MIRDDFICLWTDEASIAELSLMDDGVAQLKKYYDVDAEPPVFFFNRIKAKEEGKGQGTLLMSVLVKILDSKGITVANHLNPYGSMDLEALVAFYTKYGFRLVQEGFMIRIPGGAI